MASSRAPWNTLQSNQHYKINISSQQHSRTKWIYLFPKKVVDSRAHDPTWPAHSYLTSPYVFHIGNLSTTPVKGFEKYVGDSCALDTIHHFVGDQLLVKLGFVHELDLSAIRMIGLFRQIAKTKQAQTQTKYARTRRAGQPIIIEYLI